MNSEHDTTLIQFKRIGLGLKDNGKPVIEHANQVKKEKD